MTDERWIAAAAAVINAARAIMAAMPRRVGARKPNSFESAIIAANDGATFQVSRGGTAAGRCGCHGFFDGRRDVGPVGAERDLAGWVDQVGRVRPRADRAVQPAVEIVGGDLERQPVMFLES
jgi:hypothetical protein